MSGQILCTGCSNGDVGAIIEFVRYAAQGLRQKSIEDEKDVAQDMLSLRGKAMPPLDFILEAVGIGKERICCRTHIMGFIANKRNFTDI
jgi:hypothetical protein